MRGGSCQSSDDGGGGSGDDALDALAGGQPWKSKGEGNTWKCPGNATIFPSCAILLTECSHGLARVSER